MTFFERNVVKKRNNDIDSCSNKNNNKRTCSIMCTLNCTDINSDLTNVLKCDIRFLLPLRKHFFPFCCDLQRQILSFWSFEWKWTKTDWTKIEHWTLSERWTQHERFANAREELCERWVRTERGRKRKWMHSERTKCALIAHGEHTVNCEGRMLQGL